MKRNFDLELKSLGGVRMVISKDDPRQVTLGYVCINALMGAFEDEKQLSGEEKYQRYKLAQRIDKGAEVEVTAEDIALLKKVIGKAYIPGIVGPAYDALEDQS